MTGNDGCWITRNTIILGEPCVNWTTLSLALFDIDETITADRINQRFLMRLAEMPEEDFKFVQRAWMRYQGGRWQACCYTERAAIGRVCRRIIREAKESKNVL